MSADDQRLIAECLAGRTEAFGELVCRYQSRLFNTVYRLLGNVEDARDVVQESFLNAYQSLDSFKGEALFFTWLYRIATNTAITWRRKRKVMVSLKITQGDPEVAELVDESENSQPSFPLEQAEEERRLHQALSRLSPEHRAVLVLKDIEGQKYDTMAEILQVPVGTIRSRLHRARLELREVLLQEEKEPNQQS